MNKRFLIVIFLLALIMAPFVFAQSDDADDKDFTDSVSDAASAAGQNISDAASNIIDKAKEIGKDIGKTASGFYDNVTGKSGATTVSVVAAVAIGAAALLA